MIEIPVWTLPLMTALIFAAGVLLGCLVGYWQIGLIQAHEPSSEAYSRGYRDGKGHRKRAKDLGGGLI